MKIMQKKRIAKKEKYQSTKSINRRTLAQVFCQAVGGPRPTAPMSPQGPPDQQCQLWGNLQARRCLSPTATRPGACCEPSPGPSASARPGGCCPQPSHACGTPQLWACTCVWADAWHGLSPWLWWSWAQPCGLAFWPALAQDQEPGPVSQTQLLSLSVGQALAPWGSPWVQPCSSSRHPALRLLQELLHALSLHSRNAAQRKGCGFSL